MLYLPLPYMAFLDRAQVSAVIAHELGHFTGEDTGYSLRFAPIYRSFLDSIFSITNEHDEKDDGSRVWVAAPVTLYGKWFLASFEEAMHHWSRERELAADASAAASPARNRPRWRCCAFPGCTGSWTRRWRTTGRRRQRSAAAC